jgi:hypothetical protein
MLGVREITGPSIQLLIFAATSSNNNNNYYYYQRAIVYAHLSALARVCS